MENKQIFYKMGRIPSKKSIQLDPAIDISQNQEELSANIKYNIEQSRIRLIKVIKIN